MTMRGRIESRGTRDSLGRKQKLSNTLPFLSSISNFCSAWLAGILSLALLHFQLFCPPSFFCIRREPNPNQKPPQTHLFSRQAGSHFAMNDQVISIEGRDDPNPYVKRTFTVHLYDLSVYTTVTSRPSVVRKWLYHALYLHRRRRDKLVVGLGVQWRPSSSAGSPRPEAATLQICIGSRCLIFQLLYADTVPLKLRRFLDDPSITFVGVCNHSDARMLRRSRHNLAVRKIVDIRDVAAERRGLRRNMSMEELAEILLDADDVKKPITIGRSAWDVYWLDPDQVQYACVDAVISFMLGKELQAWSWN